MTQTFFIWITVLLTCGYFAFTDPSIARPVCKGGPALPNPQDVTSALPCRKPNSRLLRYVDSLNAPEFEQFFAADHLRQGQPVGQLQITWIGSNFEKHLLGKVEGHSPVRELDVYKLKQFAHGNAIVKDIGGPVEVTLHDVWLLLKRQSHGENGLLRTDARPNVFFVRGSHGRLWAVDAVWGGAGWEIGASRLDNPRLWNREVNIIAR